MPVSGNLVGAQCVCAGAGLPRLRSKHRRLFLCLRIRRADTSLTPSKPPRPVPSKSTPGISGSLSHLFLGCPEGTHLVTLRFAPGTSLWSAPSPRCRAPSLVAQPPGPSAATLALAGSAPTRSELPLVSVPATQPPEGAFPQPPAARLPRALRPLRAARARPITPQRRGTSQASILCETSGGKAAPKSEPCPSLRDRHPVLCRLTRHAWQLKEIKNRGRWADSLFRSAVEILPPRFKVYSLRCVPP